MFLTVIEIFSELKDYIKTIRAQLDEVRISPLTELNIAMQWKGYENRDVHHQAQTES